MKKTVLILIFTVFINSLQGQLRYTETVFEHADTLKNIEYAVADWLNSPVSLLSEYNIHSSESKTEKRPLYMDIFMPHADTVTNRPAILFAFSGGFLTGSRHADDMVAFCDSFARRGYVTASIDYRIGMAADVSSIFGIPYHISVSEINATRSVYRAIQDSRAAIRFLKHNAKNYGIDTTRIYMVGSSAGAFVALHNLYMDKPGEIPELALVSPNIGNLDTVGIQGYNSQADAIVSMWGAIQTPALIEKEQKPVLLIHGEKDSIVYFKKGMPLKYSIPDLDALDYNIPETYGAYCIDTALLNRNIPHQTYFVANKKHEFYGVDTGEFEESGPNQYWDTVHWKISEFLFDIFKPKVEFSIEITGTNIICTNHTNNVQYSEWDFGDGNANTGMRVTHSYSTHGSYRIKLSTCNASMACDTLSQKVNITLVNLPQLEKKQPIFYPNPVQNYLFMENIAGHHNIEVFDVYGRKHLHLFQYANRMLDISMLRPGIYILRIKLNENIITHKFQKIE